MQKTNPAWTADHVVAASLLEHSIALSWYGQE